MKCQVRSLLLILNTSDGIALRRPSNLRSRQHLSSDSIPVEWAPRCLRHNPCFPRAASVLSTSAVPSSPIHRLKQSHLRVPHAWSPFQHQPLLTKERTQVRLWCGFTCPAHTLPCIATALRSHLPSPFRLSTMATASNHPITARVSSLCCHCRLASGAAVEPHPTSNRTSPTAKTLTQRPSRRASSPPALAASRSAATKQRACNRRLLARTQPPLPSTSLSLSPIKR
jgi:hypothetical protein